MRFVKFKVIPENELGNVAVEISVSPSPKMKEGVVLLLKSQEITQSSS